MGAPAATSPVPSFVPRTRATTLLALVSAIGEVTDDEREVVETVLHLLQTGQVRLTGNFRNAPLSDFE